MIKTLKDIKLPATLYKYRDWKSKLHKHILTKQIAYFSSPAHFNDPFDCKIPIRYDIEPEKLLEEIYFKSIKAGFPDRSDEEIRAFSKRRVHEGEVDPKTFKKNDKKYFDDLDERMGIFSLSEHNDDILMWGHYANSHQGFCIGFDTQELLKTNDVDFIGKVEYYPEFPVIIPKLDLEELYVMQIFSKWDKWSYEDEYRLTKNQIKNRKIKLSKKTFKEIILGYQMPNNERDKMIKVVNSYFSGIQFFEAKPHEEKFLIEIKRIE